MNNNYGIFEKIQFLNESTTYISVSEYKNQGMNDKQAKETLKKLFELLDKAKGLNKKGKQILSNGINNDTEINNKMLNINGIILIKQVLKNMDKIEKDINNQYNISSTISQQQMLIIQQMEQQIFNQQMQMMNQMAYQAHADSVNSHSMMTFGHPIM